MCELLDKYKNRGTQQGIQLGIQQGMQQGIQQGELRLASLVEKLQQSDRLEDLQKVVSNKYYRKLLFEELGIL